MRAPADGFDLFDDGAGIVAAICDEIASGRQALVQAGHDRLVGGLAGCQGDATRMACVVVALPRRTCPIVLPSIPNNGLHHQTVGSNASRLDNAA